MSETAVAQTVQPAPREQEESMIVRLSRLDHMLELAGEVIIVSSNLNAVSRQLREGLSVNREMAESVKDLAITSGRISSDLHNLVTDVRTVDMSDLFARFRRLARDTSRRLGKTIRFEVQGEEVSIDKKTSEKIYDPIAHQIRNAIDHGIEDAQTRQALGKDPVGCVTLRVCSKENTTVIEVEDDGAGIDAERIRDKLVEQNWCDQSAADRMGVDDLYEYLYSAGFSTADQASVTSGRGVGMDVIRTVINELNGETFIQSEKNKGTVFSFVLPKVTAVNISDALLVRAGRNHFAFPVTSVVATRSISLPEITTVRGRNRTIMHLGAILPLFDLLEVLGDRPVEAEDDGMVRVMIVEYKHRQAAYVVSDFLSPQKIVISEFDGINVPGLSGTAVLSGRQLAMVIDLPRLFDLTFGTEEERDVLRNVRRGGQESIPLGEVAPEATAEGLVAPAVETAGAPGACQESPAPAQPPDREAPEDLFGEDCDEEFLQEVSSMLSKLNRSLLALDESREPAQADAIFRLVHSIKGNLTMYGAESAASFTHRVETLLEQCRDGKQEMSDEVFDVLFDGCRHLEEVVAALLKSQAPPEADAGLCQGLERYESSQSAQADPEKDWSDSPVVLDATGEFYLSSRRREGASLFRMQLQFDPGDQPAFLVAYLILRRVQHVGDVLGTLPPMSQIEAGHCEDRMAVLLAPRQEDPEALERLGENLKRYFGATSIDTSRYA
jgi:two-component system chemotaxis sensor kinase CheA